MRDKITFFLAVLGTVSFLTGALLFGFEIVVFSDPAYSFMEKEYIKYDVKSDLDMEMSDIMYVTTEMMEYLKGNRETLSAVTTIGQSREEFFNEQDRFHMEEVQHLMLLAHNNMYLFLAAGVLMMAGAGLLGYGRKRNSTNGLLAGAGIFLAVTAGAVLLGVFNFEKLFEWFHLLLFDNDQWMFDPSADYMIRMLPEGLFMDIAVRIGMVFGIVLAVFLISTIAWKIRIRSKEDQEIYIAPETHDN